MSYVAENAAALVIRLLDVLPDAKQAELRGLHFPVDAIRGRKISGVRFRKCSFAQTSLDAAMLTRLQFENCEFAEIQLADSMEIVDVRFQDCVINCVRVGQAEIYEPVGKLKALNEAGFSAGENRDLDGPEPVIDELTELAERALRTFLRATAVNESTLKKRLGVRSQQFLDEILPLMLERRVLKEVDFTGGGRPQRRFKVGISMQDIQEASRGRGLPLADFVETLAKD